MELLRALGTLAEQPDVHTADLARLVGLDPPTPEEWHATFVERFYPYASVHLGQQGFLGGPVRDGVAGVLDTIGARVAQEADHLAVLLDAIAHVDERGWVPGRAVLLWEHILPWTLPYLDRVAMDGAGPFRDWAQLLSAVLAEGRTVIHDAATEPEVVELALFLQRMGAHIALRPDRRFVVEGVERLTGAEAHLQGDRLEAFSYLVAGLMTGGAVRVGGCGQDRMVTAINTLQRMGADFEITDEWISARASKLRPSAVQTDTHPGFMTDWQPPLIVLMTQADGMSVLHETVYEDRLGYVDALKAMGGEIELFDTCLGGPACRFHDSSALHSAVVRGVSKLQGADVTIPDVRAGFSSVIAAAAAEGASTLHGIHHLERGYNAPFDTLVSLGLNLRRV